MTRRLRSGASITQARAQKEKAPARLDFKKRETEVDDPVGCLPERRRKVPRSWTKEEDDDEALSRGSSFFSSAISRGPGVPRGGQRSRRR